MYCRRYVKFLRGNTDADVAVETVFAADWKPHKERATSDVTPWLFIHQMREISALLICAGLLSALAAGRAWFVVVILILVDAGACLFGGLLPAALALLLAGLLTGLLLVLLAGALGGIPLTLIAVLIVRHAKFPLA